MFKGVLTEDSSVRVTFKADHSNNGSTGFFFGYVPKEGREEETVAFTPVAPGGADTVESTVPAASTVWSLKIRIDVPDDEGTGRLIVETEGEEIDNSPIKKDVTWTYAVTEP